ncbi:MAG: hypothetical protein PVH63_06245 [Balneolaceae bacterium]
MRIVGLVYFIATKFDGEVQGSGIGRSCISFSSLRGLYGRQEGQTFRKAGVFFAIPPRHCGLQEDTPWPNFRATPKSYATLRRPIRKRLMFDLKRRQIPTTTDTCYA